MEEGFIVKAERNIASAERCFAVGDYDTSANRAYYACFHAAVAVLGRYGIENAKNPHDWVQSQLAAELVHRRKLFPKDMIPMLLDIQRIRHSADYEPKILPKSVATKQLKQAQSLVQTIFQHLEQHR